jgi:hypothetical protein
VVEVPVHRQLTAPLSALAFSTIFYLALAKWNVWIALAGGVSLYVAGLAWSDGRQLAEFLRTIVHRPPTNTPQRHVSELGSR